VTSSVPLAPSRRWQLPRIDPSDRWIGGVAAAIAREIGVQPSIIRVSFAVLALAGGWGLVFYATSWVVLAVAQPRQMSPYRPAPKAANSTHRHVAVVMIVLGLLLMLRNLSVVGFSDPIVFPAGFVVIGFLIAWTRHKPEAGISAVARIVAGVIVGVGGMMAYIFVSVELIDAVLVLLVAIAVVSGVGLVAAPSLARIGNDLDTERQNRVRADERARMAAHLHDSVLQTLALIQRHAEDPVTTTQLARQQERELRHWLYDAPKAGATPGTVRLSAALDEMAAEVDSAHGVDVKVITVGDNTDLPAGSLDELVAAAREAAVNAAKHSGTKRVDVFAERHADRIEVFVRDTGCGFDPDQTGVDRRGIAESIVGRMERAGGAATIHAAPGTGTEVELVAPIPQGNQPVAGEPVGTGSLSEQAR
jgi:signal transduction histidine kinase/phage shock protein PspC (stress-responsive transcriptional regulator)